MASTAVDGDALVVARLLAGGVLGIGLGDDRFGSRWNLLICPIAAPQLGGRRELFEAQRSLGLFREPGLVMEQEALAVRREDEWHVERLGVLERLLHAAAKRIGKVLGLDDRERQILLQEQHVVRLPPLAARHHVPAYDDLSIGERDFAAHLTMQIPPSALAPA